MDALFDFVIYSFWPALQLWMRLAGYLAIVAVVVIVVRGLLTPLTEMLRPKRLEWDGEFEPGRPSVIVIHGTWGRKSEWFTEAPLFDAIRDRFSSEVNVARFYWSGFNSLTARFRGAAALAASMQRIQDDSPSERILLLGHSHAGNVATLACKKLQSPYRTGLVAVSTPFLYYRYRELGPGSNALLSASAAAAAAVATSIALKEAISALAMQPFMPSISAELVTLLAVSGTVLGAVLVGVVMSICNSVFDGESERILEARLAGPAKTCVVRAPFDEASGVLSAARALISILRMPVRACSHLRAVCQHAWSILAVPVFGIACFVILLGVILVNTLGDDPKVHWAHPIVTALMFLGVFGVFLLTLLRTLPPVLLFALVFLGLPCILVAAIIVSVAYGVEVFSMSLRLDVGVEASPHGEAVITQIERLGFERFTLDHSAILSDAAARDEVVSILWLLSKKL